MAAGPFDVSAARVAALDNLFTEFVNELLERERAASGLAGHLLSMTLEEHSPDGGVDAATRDASASDWIPEGNTAWQFKRSGLGAKGCADEFSRATWAHPFVSEGGSYILAIGAQLNDRARQERRDAIAQSAIELKLVSTDPGTRIRVYDANQLARWASSFASIAVGRVVGGPGRAVIDYQQWALSGTQQHAWTADPHRDDQLAAIRVAVTAGVSPDGLRVQGEDGIGKTRLVMEALSDAALGPLVLYVHDERSVSAELLGPLADAGRRAILVVDECPPSRHMKIAEQLPVDSQIDLITVGGLGGVAARRPVVTVEAMAADSLEGFLQRNYGELGPEARRFIVEHSHGNIRWTIVLADRVIASPGAQAADLIARNDIEQFVAHILPEGRDFLCSSLIALFSRVGWDAEVRSQVTLLADFAGVNLDEMDRVAMYLEERGLLAKAGRYRKITPHPFAVFLAADAWRRNAGRIVGDLLPSLGDDMAVALFTRVADLGRFAPAREVLSTLLRIDGPFSSIRSIEDTALGRQLTQLAIVMPDEVAMHLSELIEATSLDELRERVAARRDLVWTLEKLVWHRATFERAANALSRLALAENETYGNNATGTWVQLFGTLLPGTAATPAQRAAYLADVATQGPPELKRLAVSGCSRALQTVHESILVSGELQGGVLVEPRGTPVSDHEAGEYRRSALAILTTLANDGAPTVAVAAEDALIQSMQGLIVDPVVGDDISDALLNLEGPARRRVRSHVQHLLALYERTNHQDRPVAERVREFSRRLPHPTPVEELEVLLEARRWDLPDGELQARVDSVLRSIDFDADGDQVFAMLRVDKPSTWELGYALATLGDARASTALDVILSDGHLQFVALVGYLYGLVSIDSDEAFDNFLDSSRAASLTPAEKLGVAIRGPVSELSVRRVLGELARLSVAEGARGLFGWQADLSAEATAGLVRGWLPRVETVEDYRALVDWVALRLHGQDEIPLAIGDLCFDLIQLRGRFANLGREEWDWCEIARRIPFEHGPSILHTIFELVDSRAIPVHEGGPEGQLVVLLAQSHPEAAWQDIADRVMAGSWRIQLDFRGWVVEALPVMTLENWVDGRVDRARVVAAMAPVGADDPTPACRYLLDNFGDDAQVVSRLSAQFYGGSWIGNESDRLAAKINQLNGWRERPGQSLGLRRWAADMVRALEVDRLGALRDEAEEML